MSLHSRLALKSELVISVSGRACVVRGNRVVFQVSGAASSIASEFETLQYYHCVRSRFCNFVSRDAPEIS